MVGANYFLPKTSLSSAVVWAAAETAGCAFPFRKRYEVEPYYEHQNETGTAPNRQVNALGFVFSMNFSLP
jgi:hypothetical protein